MPMRNDAAGQAPVILVRTGNDELTAIRTAPGSGWMPLGQQVVDSVRGLLGNDSGQAHGRCFQLPVDELDKWDTLRHYDRGDGFSYAVGWGDDGKFEKMFSIKEVSPRAMKVPLDPVAVMNAMAIAQMQASINGLTEAVDAIGADVRATLIFLHNQQQAAVLAAVETIDEIHASLGRDRTLGRTDWERISNLEQLLKDQHRQVLAELTKIADALEFRDVAAAKSSLHVTPERVQHLVTLEYYLLRSFHRWTELMLTWKSQSDEATPSNIVAARDRVTTYTKDACDNIERIRLTDTAINGRNPWTRLLKDGFVFGALNDRRNTDTATRNRAAIQQAADVDLTRALPAPRARLELCAPVADNTNSSAVETVTLREVS